MNSGPSRATAGPYHPPPSPFCTGREETWGEVSPHHPTRGSGSVVSSPSGVRSGAPAENRFYAYFRSFSVLLSDGGAPNVAGPGKTPPFPPLDGPECYILSRVWEFRHTALQVISHNGCIPLLYVTSISHKKNVWINIRGSLKSFKCSRIKMFSKFP